MLSYGVDFGKNEIEVLKHETYLKPPIFEELLELLAT